MESSDGSNKNFFKHVFNFDDESKSEILNMLQYALMGIIPVIILNKILGVYVPEPDETKGSLELSAEIIIQLLVIFLGMLIIHRIITFVPTYSGMKYGNWSVIAFILPMLVLLLCLPSRAGGKSKILVERVVELWEGKTDKKQNNKGGKNGNVKVSQPISGQMMNNAAMNQSLYTDGTAINSLPTNLGNENTLAPQQLPNYNAMYKQENTPLVGAASPAEGFSEPMAANSVLGGSFGSTW